MSRFPGEKSEIACRMTVGACWFLPRFTSSWINEIVQLFDREMIERSGRIGIIHQVMANKSRAKRKIERPLE